MRAQLWILAALALLTACGQQQPARPGMKIGKPYVIDGKTYYPEYDASYDKIGVASWYGPGFHGKYTANGEVFNQNDLTAAHPTLPMPSLVRVTNIENGKSAILRINDRGPFKASRIIDLSKKSAQTLGIHSLAKVRVQFLQRETEEYMANVQSGSGRTDMASYNRREEERKEAAIVQATEPSGAEIVESTVSSGHSGETVADAAPVLSVGSGDLDGRQQSIQVSDNTPIATPAPTATATPQPVTLTRNEHTASTASKIPRIVQVNPNETITEIAQPAQEPDNSDVAEADEEIEPGAITLSSPSKQVRPAPTAPAPKQSAKAAPARKDLSPAAGGSAGNYFIQAGSFAAEENAHKLRNRLGDTSNINIEKVEMSGRTWWRVRVGPFNDKQLADASLDQVRSAGASDARIVQQ